MARKVTKKVRTKHENGWVSAPRHPYIALAIPEQAKKKLDRQARIRVLRQVQVLAQSLRALTNLLNDNSDKLASGSVKSTGESTDLVKGLEIVSESDGTKRNFQEQGHTSLSFFSEKTVMNAKPGDKRHQTLVKKNLHVIKSKKRRLGYVLSAKDTCSYANGEARSWLTRSQVRAFDLLALLKDCGKRSQPPSRLSILVHGRRTLSALSSIVKDLLDEGIAADVE